ncbi:pentatricopeptide repeat-containing protein At2g13600-like isoform X2 [Selaginella moellendorffii]|uniref:pentatricopeptide repeat-containing protein At2g13600-like isoform X2 n=1 Tax=Selaginella moellendorffii TaxID=88036 RepID=UPI000D1C5B89|nr:pentatricopeptide repeat-containing protein At2g13600-like isoform X2 [Selaginella moellendorffii]|eukprot:XP_024522654.1 pentatricopeptide repeat-containing protein At2g13600-like isoform X2 [Selaginella moellendorffii]
MQYESHGSFHIERGPGENDKRKSSLSGMLAALKLSSSSRNLELGKKIHADAVQSGNEANIYMASTLVDMYAKCGCLAEARKVFDNMPSKNVVSWTSLMLGYVQNCQARTALELFQRMVSDGCVPDAQTYVAALKACSNLVAKESGSAADGRLRKMVVLETGFMLHSLAAPSGCDSDIYVASTLVDMYSKCGSMEDARKVFLGMELASRNVVLWTALMTGYAHNGEGELALELLGSMNCAPNSLTFVAALKACSALAAKEEGQRSSDGKMVKMVALEAGMLVHARAGLAGLESDIFVASTLVDFYAKSGSLNDSYRIFDAMPEGEGEKALELFSQMMHRDGCEVDAQALVVGLRACIASAGKEEARKIDDKTVELVSLSSGVRLKEAVIQRSMKVAALETGMVLKDEVIDRMVKVVSLERGMALHREARKRGFEKDIFVSSALLDMYSHCGSLVDALKIFEGMPCHNAVTWNALLLAYAQNGERDTALDVFAWMRLHRESYHVDGQTFASALKACAGMAALDMGRAIHVDACRCGAAELPAVVNCVVDLYGKCGSTEAARREFDAAGVADVVTWNALVSGYAWHADVAEVFGALYDMRRAGVKPDRITFLAILTACSHGGLVDKGIKLFEKMDVVYGIRPDVEHYHCMVDLLGRANQLERAVEMVRSMPVEPNTVTWMTVLGACWKWKNVELGRLAFESVVEKDRRELAAYMLMANIYGSAGMWEEKMRVREMGMELQKGEDCVAHAGLEPATLALLAPRSDHLS